MPFFLATGLFWTSVACCLIAQFLIVRSVLGARHLPAPNPDLPRARAGVELLWAVAPAIALGALLLFTWRAIEARETRTAIPSAESSR
jgi:heme/copper-type cytochrome/quinol oxidase subunit 2